jgi:hypothetical protein
VYECDARDGSFRPEDLLGESVFDINQHMIGDPVQVYPLLDVNGQRVYESRVKIDVRTKRVEVAKLTFSARNVVGHDTTSKSDPLLVIFRRDPTGNFVFVDKSECVMNSHSR